jgi:hypothetical protein
MRNSCITFYFSASLLLLSACSRTIFEVKQRTKEDTIKFIEEWNNGIETKTIQYIEDSKEYKNATEEQKTQKLQQFRKMKLVYTDKNNKKVNSCNYPEIQKGFASAESILPAKVMEVGGLTKINRIYHQTSAVCFMGKEYTCMWPILGFFSLPTMEICTIIEGE